MSEIINGAPFTNLLGIDDKSTRTLVPERENLPTNLPYIYAYTKKGPLTPQLVVGATRARIYGAESFDPSSRYFNHASYLANVVNARGNSVMIQRVVSSDAPKPSSLRISLDVLATKVPTFRRNADGTYALDPDGKPVPTGQKVDGAIVRWYVSDVPLSPEGVDTFGIGTVGKGKMVDPDTGAVSDVFPIMDLEASSIGAWGNDQAIRLSVPTTMGPNPVKASMLSKQRVYPFRLTCLARQDQFSTARPVNTLQGDPFVEVVAAPEFVDIDTDQRISIDERFIQAYQDLSGAAGTGPIYGPFGRLFYYRDNHLTVARAVVQRELPFVDRFSDFSATATGDADVWLANLFTGKSSVNVPYASYFVDFTPGASFNFTENSMMYARSGGDGTMSDVAFDATVREHLADWLDPAAAVQNTAKIPASTMYDSGFSVPTKKAMAQFIGLRKDTYVFVGTHVAGEPPLSASQETSLAASLTAALRAFPESDVYGTGTCRGTVVGRSGVPILGSYKKRLPVTIELADKVASMMGAGDGIWDSRAALDIYPNNVLGLLSEINVSFTPATARNTDWASGMCWVEDYSRGSVYFPAVRTVYDNDTSILMSVINVLGAVELQKVADRTRRKFSGRADLSKAQLAERIDKEILDETNGRFANRFVIAPETGYTVSDDARGFSYTTVIRMYGNNMNTVGTFTVETHRIEDLATA